jgi:CubicO group peptidase (beta-lactamase class C family)
MLFSSGHAARAGVATFFLFFWLVGVFGVRVARADEVDDYVRGRMAREHIPGVSLVVLRHGKVIKAKGYGYVSLELKVPATPDTVYDLASTTKPFVALLVVLLAQEGKWRLDDPIRRYVEETPEAWKDITLRHLLSHTSGIPDYLRDLQKDFPNETPPEPIVRLAMASPLRAAPGTKWDYSNTNYVLLGMALRKITGKTYDVLLRERLFSPMGLRDTRRHTPDEMVPNRAVGYLWYGGAFRNAEFLKFLMTDHGDRGLISTARDLAKWDAVLSSDTLLTAETKRAMWTPVRQSDGATAEYGLGWFVREVNGHRQISHPGGAPGTGAAFTRYPDDGLTVIVLTNGGRPFMQALERGIASRYVPGLRAAKPVRVPTNRLDAATGYYNAYGSQIVKATRDRAGLLLDDGGGLNNEFLPVAPDRFLAEEAEREFTVATDTGGNVTGATLRLGADSLPVQRIGPLARAFRPAPDPDPALTARVEAVLKAFATGGEAVRTVPGLAPQAREDYARGPAPELVGVRRVSYVATVDVSARGIERHGAKVASVLYYRLHADDGPARYVLVYLTPDGLVTDQDVVTD